MESRQIRVFISSTLRNKAERDELVKYIIPKLKTLCEYRGVTLNEIELRWGITDEEVAEGKALLICLDEIDRSRPFFLCMLGERYGWTPDSISENLLENYPLLSNMQGKSITECLKSNLPERGVATVLKFRFPLSFVLGEADWLRVWFWWITQISQLMIGLVF